ncbi:hypothetical protein [Ammoniphilus sp. CFH 90114]|uniref:hypothetical protein n=1 Tax=Ammoniphilus sp. CFH 90114 TaxID=2493665 RepID=UPI001010059A|nr:hypothetical protein [Ammoniphilus sp. CFH 90114]RXT07994.1 hypothetical protein EIZ39_11310 [Ammoniphilus sp. CFH 90114]
MPFGRLFSRKKPNEGLEDLQGRMKVLERELHRLNTRPLSTRTETPPHSVEEISRMSLKLKSLARDKADLNLRLSQLENQVHSLTELLEQCHLNINKLHKELEYMKKQPKTEENFSQQPVIINEVHVEKMFLDKYELNNNFAQLGINELSGRLNIGATYGKGVLSDEMNTEELQEMEELKKESDEENKENPV